LHTIGIQRLGTRFSEKAVEVTEVLDEGRKVFYPARVGAVKTRMNSARSKKFLMFISNLGFVFIFVGC